MTEGKRVSSESAICYPEKMDGNLKIQSCMRCSLLFICRNARNNRYVEIVCRETGEDIPYPATGPVGERCPLPGYVDASLKG